MKGKYYKTIMYKTAIICDPTNSVTILSGTYSIVSHQVYSLGIRIIRGVAIPASIVPDVWKE